MKTCSIHPAFLPLFLIAGIGLLAWGQSPGETKVMRTFQRIELSDQFWCEGASFADFNRDGAMDVVAGPWWWAGPDFKNRTEIYLPEASFQLGLGSKTWVAVPGFEGGLGKKNTYSDNFFAFPHDFNSDGWTDVLIVGFPGRATAWYENPKGASGHWARHAVFLKTDNESPTFADITGDGKPELVCITNGAYGYAAVDWKNAATPWTWHAITPNRKYGNFTHGLGLGDVNGDGKADLLEKDGWWEQPASLDGDPLWKHHPFAFSGPGGAQMYAYDVNGDGLNDVITSLAAHGFGLAWFEQIKTAEGVSFRQHRIMGSRPAENRYGVKFSELHAIDLVDIDGDGLKDIVTGKRFWSHGRTGDPDRNDEAVLYWFQLKRAGQEVEYIPHRIDGNSGVGTQIVAGDINGDKLPDVVVGNKKGIFVLLQKVAEVPAAEWEKQQPKALPPQPPAKNLPVKDASGRVLDFGFESGTLADWEATGTAFDGNPQKGDAVARRRQDMRSGHQGEGWVGSYEAHGDSATGTLTSVAFPITEPYASFLIGGGSTAKTRVEIINAVSGVVLFRCTGPDNEQMKRVFVDLRPFQGGTLRIRLVDEAQTGWGHLNFDDFLLHDAPPADAEETK